MSNKLLGVFFVTIFFIFTTVQENSASESGLSGLVVGDKVNPFSLKSVSGKHYSLNDFRDSRAIVLMFIATQCPVSNAYNERMVQLFKDYQENKVAFIGINSNKQESIEEIKEHARDNGFQFPVLKDHNNIIADRFNAQVTPEIFVLASDHTLLYHGRIDDSRRENSVSSRDLRKALDEILSEKPVSKSETKAFGCTIKRISR